jgi:hypothetical protein
LVLLHRFFFEAATGLLLTEHWLMGMSNPSHSHHHSHDTTVEQEHLEMIDTVKKSETGAFELEDVSVMMNHGMYIVKLNDKKVTLVTISPDSKEFLCFNRSWSSCR